MLNEFQDPRIIKLILLVVLLTMMTGVCQMKFSYIWIPCGEIDWFANDNNHKLPVFYSRYWNINAIGIDAFTINWNGVNGWFVPPVCIVSRVLRNMKQCLAFGSIIVPLWRSASFWPILSPSGDSFIKEGKGCINLPANKIFFNPGKGKKGVFGNIDLPFRMLALKIDYRLINQPTNTFIFQSVMVVGWWL
jgi:hypothetical protein